MSEEQVIVSVIVDISSRDTPVRWCLYRYREKLLPERTILLLKIDVYPFVSDTNHVIQEIIVHIHCAVCIKRKAGYRGQEVRMGYKAHGLCLNYQTAEGQTEEQIPFHDIYGIWW